MRSSELGQSPVAPFDLPSVGAPRLDPAVAERTSVDQRWAGSCDRVPHLGKWRFTFPNPPLLRRAISVVRSLKIYGKVGSCPWNSLLVRTRSGGHVFGGTGRQSADFARNLRGSIGRGGDGGEAEREAPQVLPSAV